MWGGHESYKRVKGIFNDMDTPVLRGSEKWYDMSREEQQENALMRLRNIFDNHKEEYFTNFKQYKIMWYTLGFQGMVRFYLSKNGYTSICLLL